MENSMKTHDFMNVESFSQLPFIRPSPALIKENERPIRLFGIEFGTAEDIHRESESKENNDDNNNSNNNEESKREKDSNNNANSNNNNRRFECHYCCRNFPTSQALGGHQNAHKRERQHAKRIHFHSAAAASALVHHHGAGLLSDPNVYGAAALVSYGRLGSAAPFSSAVPSSYSSWSSSRVYGNHHGLGTYSQTTAPINGSPLGLWRVPPSSSVRSSYTSATLNRDRPSKNQPLALFSGDHESKPSHVGGGSSAHSLFYETKTSVQDHVSLDLHL